jgi:hypothetical protein
VATAGGKGAELLSDNRLSTPMNAIYKNPAVRKIWLHAVSQYDKAESRKRYSDEAAVEVCKYGIGAYSVAAWELEAKLVQERHSPKDPPSPDGAAIVRAAIDWSRAGLIRAIPENDLRQLWRYHARGGEPTEDRFLSGLEWGRNPVHGIPLLDRVLEVGDGEMDGEASYRAYDYMVGYVDRQQKSIDAQLWDRILEFVRDDEAATVAAIAFARGSWPRANRVLLRAAKSENLEARADAYSVLYQIAEERGDEKLADQAFGMERILRG